MGYEELIKAKNYKGPNSVNGVPDLIWKDKKTGAGVYVSDLECAQSMKTLKQYDLYNIVNAQSVWTINYHDYDDDFNYLRFPIGELYSLPQRFNPKTPNGAVRFINPLLDFIENCVKDGENVMIHCIAGKHRAGTSMCAWLMYADGMTMNQAINYAKKKRKRIDPWGDIKKCLENFGEGLKEDPTHKFRTKYDAKKDHTDIIKSCPKEKDYMKGQPNLSQF